MLEANAAMKSIVRRDTGEDWKEYVTRLMQEEGVIEKEHEPTDEEVRRYDKQRKNKKVSNEEWVSESDPESRITQMKDGRTHLAYKAEHVVDLKSDLVLAAEIRPATAADTETMVDSVIQARVNLEAAGSEAEIEEAAADKGYHAADTLELCEFVGLRTYIPEPQRKHERRWTDKPAEFQRAVYNNRRRMRRSKGKQLQRGSQRTLRTDLCSHLRLRRRATDLVASAAQRHEALPDCRRGAQFGPHPAQAVRRRQAEELTGRIRPCRACAD